MASIAAGRVQVEELLTEGVAIGVINAPTSVVVSGDEAAVLEVVERAKVRGWKATRLRVSHAFHSGRMDPGLGDFRAVLDEVTFAEPQLVGLSNVTGGLAGRWTDPAYWVDHLRQAVLFSDNYATSRRSGCYRRPRTRRRLHPHLPARPDPETPGRSVAALRKDREEPLSLLSALGELHCQGVLVDWAPLFPGARLVDLPTYAFQRDRYWLDGPGPPPTPARSGSPRPVTRCSAAVDSPAATVSSSPDASPSTPTPGSPTTASSTRSSSPARPSSRWRSGPVTR